MASAIGDVRGGGRGRCCLSPPQSEPPPDPTLPDVLPPPQALDLAAAGRPQPLDLQPPSFVRQAVLWLTAESAGAIRDPVALAVALDHGEPAIPGAGLRRVGGPRPQLGGDVGGRGDAGGGRLGALDGQVEMVILFLLIVLGLLVGSTMLNPWTRPKMLPGQRRSRSGFLLPEQLRHEYRTVSTILRLERRRRTVEGSSKNVSQVRSHCVCSRRCRLCGFLLNGEVKRCRVGYARKVDEPGRENIRGTGSRLPDRDGVLADSGRLVHCRGVCSSCA